MQIKCENLFQGLIKPGAKEIFDILLETGNLRLERIVSKGQSTPHGEWLSQDQDEWVVLLQGAATLSFETDKRQLNMQPGDYVNIAAHCRHRVEWTDSNSKTVWLAIHYKSSV